MNKTFAALALSFFAQQAISSDILTATFDATLENKYNLGTVLSNKDAKAFTGRFSVDEIKDFLKNTSVTHPKVENSKKLNGSYDLSSIGLTPCHPNDNVKSTVHFLLTSENAVLVKGNLFKFTTGPKPLSDEEKVVIYGNSFKFTEESEILTNEEKEGVSDDINIGVKRSRSFDIEIEAPAAKRHAPEIQYVSNTSETETEEDDDDFVIHTSLYRLYQPS